MTPTGEWRFSLLRMYWDDETRVRRGARGDFFASGQGASIRHLFARVCVNSGQRVQSYWPCVRKKAKITMENLDRQPDAACIPSSITRRPVPADAAYFMPSQKIEWRSRQAGLHDSRCVQGKGHYGALIWRGEFHNTAGWGEGEIQFILDGDRQSPSTNRHGRLLNGSYQTSRTAKS